MEMLGSLSNYSVYWNAQLGGSYSFPNTVTASTPWQETRVFVSLSAELFPCSDSSMAVSTPVKAAALFKPSQVKTIMRQSFPTSCTSHMEFFTFPFVGVASCEALGMFTA